MTIADCYVCTNDTYTFYSSDNSAVSRIDHAVMSKSFYDRIEDIWVNYNMITSDHHPLSVKLSISKDANRNTNSAQNLRNKINIKWDRISYDEIDKCKANLYMSLSDVETNHDLILCDNPSCNSVTHQNAISRMYAMLVAALHNASKSFNTLCNKEYKQHKGWNEYCELTHQEARDAYLTWRDRGKTRQGYLFDNMKRTRANFKLAFRKCKSLSVSNQADCLANKLLNKNDQEFWKEIKRLNNNSHVTANTINNVTGAENIVYNWKEYYENVFNSCTDDSKKDYVLNHVKDTDLSFNRFTVVEVVEAIQHLKNGKTCGLDNLYSEHFKYGNDKLAVLLCIHFYCMIVHNFIILKVILVM